MSCVTLRPEMSGPRRKKASLLYGPRDVKFTPQRKEIFLTELRRHGLQHQAAEMAGVHLYTVREHRKNDDDFAAAFDCALGFYREKLEAEIHRRAVDGVDKPVHKNTALPNAMPTWEVVGHIREFSDTLLIFHAKRHIAAYRDNDREDDAATGGVLVVPGTLSESDWEQQAKG